MPRQASGLQRARYPGANGTEQSATLSGCSAVSPSCSIVVRDRITTVLEPPGSLSTMKDDDDNKENVKPPKHSKKKDAQSTGLGAGLPSPPAPRRGCTKVVKKKEQSMS